MSRVRVHPGAGKLNGAGFAAPKRLSTERKLGVPRSAKRVTTRRSAASCTERDEDLVLHEAVPAIQPVPRPDRVERVEVPRDRHDLPDTPPRRSPEPHLVEGGDGWRG